MFMRKKENNSPYDLLYSVFWIDFKFIQIHSRAVYEADLTTIAFSVWK